MILTLQLNLGSVLPSPLPASTDAPQYSLTVLKLNLSKFVSGIEQPALVSISKSYKIQAGSVVQALSVLKVPLNVPA